MKKFNFIYGAVAASMMFFASCSNDTPVFDDADAFVAFTKTTMSVDEFGQTLDVPVLLTSLSGMSGTVTFEADSTSTAVEGVHYTFAGEKTLSFSGLEGSTQYIKLNIIDNDEFGGDVKLVLNLTAVTGVNMGATKKCTVTISDDEHPLLFLFNTYKVSATSYFGSSFDWEVSISKDDTDLKKVWISNLSAYFTSIGYVAPSTNYFYGIVNADNTQISIPVGQETGLATSSGSVTLEGFDGPDPDVVDMLSAGSYIVVDIVDNGNKLVFQHAWGTTVGGAGWYDLFYGGLEMNKK